MLLETDYIGKSLNLLLKGASKFEICASNSLSLKVISDTLVESAAFVKLV